MFTEERTCPERYNLTHSIGYVSKLVSLCSIVQPIHFIHNLDTCRQNVLEELLRLYAEAFADCLCEVSVIFALVRVSYGKHVGV